MDDEKTKPIDTDIEDSNPNAAGPQGLEGGMGISSERKGPDGGTDGTQATFGVEADAEADAEAALSGLVSATGPEMDDTQQEATQDWRDDQTPARPAHDVSVDPAGDSDADTAGDIEENTAEVPGHEFDPAKNPGHSHG